MSEQEKVKCDECKVSYAKDLMILKNPPRYPYNKCTFCYDRAIGLW